MKAPDFTILDMAKVPHPSDQAGIIRRVKQLIDTYFDGNQGDLAKAAKNMQPAAMSNLLGGKKPATVKQLRHIEAASRARFDWLVSGKEPMLHPVGWVPDSGVPAKEGDYLRAFVDTHKAEFTQTRLSELLGVSRSTVGDYFRTANFDPATRTALLDALRQLTDGDLTETDVFGGGMLVGEPEAGYQAGGSRLRPVGNLSGEPVLTLPFVPVRARAGVSTPRYWEHPPEMTRVLRSSLEDMEPDVVQLRRNWWIIEVDGDSMEPQLVSRSRVLAYYVPKEAVADLKPGVWAIQYDDDFVIKRVRSNRLETEQGLMLHSDNPPPDPYFVRADSIRHVWYIEKTIDSKVR